MGDWILCLVLLLCGLQLAYDTWCNTAALVQQKHRGRALIIANTSFRRQELDERLGTDIDIEKLESVFRGLNFEVVVHRNLSSHVRYSCLLLIYSLSLLVQLLAYALFKAPCVQSICLRTTIIGREHYVFRLFVCSLSIYLVVLLLSFS